jgi:hypothetical protein
MKTCRVSDRMSANTRSTEMTFLIRVDPGEQIQIRLFIASCMPAASIAFLYKAGLTRFIISICVLMMRLDC